MNNWLNSSPRQANSSRISHCQSMLTPACQNPVAKEDLHRYTSKTDRALVAIDKFDTGKLTLFAETPIQVGRFHIFSQLRLRA